MRGAVGRVNSLRGCFNELISPSLRKESKCFRAPEIVKVFNIRDE